MCVQLVQIFVTAVLTAAIRVVHEAVRCAERANGVVQRDERRVMRKIATEMPADDPPCKEIRHQKQIRKQAAFEAQIGDVADDHLAGGGDRHRFYQIRRDGVVMPRIRRLRMPAFALHESVVRAQHRKEMIAPDRHAPHRQMVWQFAGADAWQRVPHGLDVREHYRVRVSRGAVTLAPFVVGVARAPEDAADGREAVAGASVGASDGIPKFFFKSVL